MARRIGVTIVFVSIVGLLAGCALRMAQRDPWRGQAENQCLAQKLVRASAYTAPMESINGPGTCGMDHPFRVTAFAEGTVTLRSKAVLACPMISTVDLWLAEVVQPAAAAYFGTYVVELKTGSYSCRSVNNQRGGRISEHAYGNAVDLMGLILADGREVNVERGWRGDPADQDFLREVFTGACRYFSTVLAPGSDAFHYNHFHMDLARRSSGRVVCKPALKWTSPLVASASGSSYGANSAATAGYGYPQTPAGMTPRSYPQAAPTALRDDRDPLANRSTSQSEGFDDDPLAVDEPGEDVSSDAPPAHQSRGYSAAMSRSTPAYGGPAPMDLRPPGAIRY